MDNAKIHHGDAILELADQFGTLPNSVCFDLSKAFFMHRSED